LRHYHLVPEICFGNHGWSPSSAMARLFLFNPVKLRYRLTPFERDPASQFARGVLIITFIVLYSFVENRSAVLVTMPGKHERKSERDAEKVARKKQEEEEKKAFKESLKGLSKEEKKQKKEEWKAKREAEKAKRKEEKEKKKAEREARKKQGEEDVSSDESVSSAESEPSEEEEPKEE